MSRYRGGRVAKSPKTGIRKKTAKLLTFRWSYWLAMWVRMPKAGLFSERSAARLRIINSTGKARISAAFRPCSSVSTPPLLLSIEVRCDDIPIAFAVL